MKKLKISASTEEKKIRLAFEEVNAFTCVLFSDRTNETDYVDVFSGDDCGAQIGRMGGRQEFSLGNRWCPVQHGMILHDLLHVLGFEHMHQHPKRDEFVNIYWENIIEGVEFCMPGSMMRDLKISTRHMTTSQSCTLAM